MESIITIDNFVNKMPQINLTGIDRSLFAVVDMGSNGIRFSISDLSPPRSRLLNCIYRERAGISLYDALHETSPDSKPFHFSKHTITQVSKTLARFKGICDSYGVPRERISVFATEAMRTAKNRDEMLGAIMEESSLSVDLMSPTMESLFGAMGARSGFHHVDGLFMDLGGGSIQMTYVNSDFEGDYHILAAKAAKSMPYGAARLTDALSDSINAQSTTQNLKKSMRETFDTLVQNTPRLREQTFDGDGVTIYFCGGGFRGYGSMLMHTDPVHPYPIPTIGGYTVPGERFIQCEAMLRANEGSEKIFGMSSRRREQFPAIVTVVQAIVDVIPKIKQVIFCSGGNREGVLYMKLPPEVRESNPSSLLPGHCLEQNQEVIGAVVQMLKSALPLGYPKAFSDEFLQYVVKHTWTKMGNLGDANSAEALHDPISGHLAGIPGLDHTSAAVIALTMCARWGSDLGPADKIVHSNLQAVADMELSWFCDYIGSLAGMLATVVPVLPVDAAKFEKLVSLSFSTVDGLGKKSRKVGIKLVIRLAPRTRIGVDTGALVSAFDKVGKKLGLGWKVVAEVVDDS